LAASNSELRGHLLSLIQVALQNVAHLEELAASNPDLETKVLGQSSLQVTVPDCGPSGGTGSL
jgi:hypothetical protein